MARVTKAQYEEAVSRAETAEAEVQQQTELIHDLERDLRYWISERDKVIARGIQRNGEYEAEIEAMKEQLIPLLEEAQERIESVTSQRNFFGQTLIAITFYGGWDINILRELAAVAISDFIPKEEDDERT